MMMITIDAEPKTRFALLRWPLPDPFDPMPQLTAQQTNQNVTANEATIKWYDLAAAINILECCRNAPDGCHLNFSFCSFV